MNCFWSSFIIFCRFVQCAYFYKHVFKIYVLFYSLYAVFGTPGLYNLQFFEQAEEIIDIGYPDQLTDGLRRVLCGHKQELCLFNAQELRYWT